MPRKKTRPNEPVTQRISWQLRHQDVADGAAHSTVWCLDDLGKVAQVRGCMLTFVLREVLEGFDLSVCAGRARGDAVED